MEATVYLKSEVWFSIRMNNKYKQKLINIISFPFYISFSPSHPTKYSNRNVCMNYYKETMLKYFLKRDSGNTILNKQRKCASAIFSACNEPICVSLQHWYGVTVIKL